MKKSFIIDTQNWDDVYFKRKNVQDWDANVQSSISNAETLDIKPLKRLKEVNLKKINIASLEYLVSFSMLSHSMATPKKKIQGVHYKT